MLTTTENRRRPKVGPPLPPIAIATVALFMASLFLPIVLAKGATFPSPYGHADIVIGYFQNHPMPVLITALLQFAASIPLVIFAATASVRLNHLGVRVPGPTIGLVGGILAAASLEMSALFTWTLTRPEMLEHPELIRVLHDLAFITGGPGFIVPSGLLLAGIAVPGLIAGLLPRWLAWAGLVIAGLSMIAMLALAFPALSSLLPIVRFPTLAWLVITAFQLPTKRNSAARAARKDTP